MTLGRGLNLSALLLALAAISALLLFALPGSLSVLYLLPAVILAALVFARLRASRYSLTVAAAMTAALFAQPHLLAMLMQPDGPVWLSLVVCTLATSAADSVEHGNARSIILLGLSLAVLLIVDPIGMLLAGFVVPVLVLQPLLRRDPQKALAFGLLVVFLPAMMGLLLSQLRIAPAPVIPLWSALPIGPHLTSSAQSAMTSPVALFLGSAIFLPAALVHFLWPSVRAGRIYAWLGFAIIAAFAMAALFGARRDAFWLAATLLPVTAALLASLEPARNRAFAATSATLCCMAGGWATLAL